MIDKGSIIKEDEQCISPSKWVTSWAKQKDEQQLLALFRSAFKDTMSTAQWRWKYGQSDPLGAVAREQGEIIAFYGGIPRNICICGQKHSAVQIGDVMVAPHRQRVFTRHGALFKVASAFVEGVVGEDKAYLCGYGFPSERHNRLGELLGLYGSIGKLLEATWPPIYRNPALLYTVRQLDTSHAHKINQLWETMAENLRHRVVLERDSSYVTHRYLQHPEVNYISLFVTQRITGKPVGLIILRDHGETGVELLDMIAASRHMPLLVKIAQHKSAQIKRSQLFSWITQSVVDCVVETDPQVNDLNLPLPTIIWQQKNNILHTYGKWWLIGGDTDFR
ncbi:MAG: GNAT family N-acetyltransferase [Desulfuromonas sp.]|nr:GNAT family N-acetyltransferase [Desulfuromonas sp.]